MQFEIFRELIEVMMAQQFTCLGHKEREEGRNKISNLAKNSVETPDKNYRVSVKRGRVHSYMWMDGQMGWMDG